mmetsp:Transcript_1921/g.2565  ORF Transcript_1921/g.2565 Transcript_1921/m.2565 type:complete len:86 (-) Transcript_1921:95-352(-)|eukprot:CAMPEP_0194764242 /NCGR_PEP_ID=MMETSP0323_2-20130528/21788_1 /TAXON_ID=2866 ORGANISM="Crypthecodinium cohnii, Strain Seligo" /NCGR_SAMPLE_ID=MMETSP0323_2 /ASSEMBLY_ACC=CAM_ASM_000346 /LENGTH=85 /DNA_ID=CAMNT_0039690901 /DNA_START=100 /DNA_END=357 /DNA_ORIENTATION=-
MRQQLQQLTLAFAEATRSSDKQVKQQVKRAKGKQGSKGVAAQMSGPMDPGTRQHQLDACPQIIASCRSCGEPRATTGPTLGQSGR